MVEFLQNILIYLKLYDDSYSNFNTRNIDGIFENSTYNAIVKFQKQNNLIPDGIVGAKTWKSLRPYTDGKLGFIVPTNIKYNFEVLQTNLDSLKRLYPFINIFSIRKKSTRPQYTRYKNW